MHGWQNLPPNPGHVFPRSEFYAPNLGHVYAWVAKSSPNSGARFSEVGMFCPRSEAGFYPVCNDMNQFFRLATTDSEGYVRICRNIHRVVVTTRRKNTKIIGTCSFHPDFAVSKVKYGFYMKNAVVYAE